MDEFNTYPHKFIYVITLVSQEDTPSGSLEVILLKLEILKDFVGIMVDQYRQPYRV